MEVKQKMTDWLDDDLKKHIFKTIKETQILQGKLDDEQKEMVKNEWKEHFTSQLNLDVEERYFYQDEWGQTDLVISFPEEIKGLKQYDSGSYMVICATPLLESQISVFLMVEEEDLAKLWKKTYLVRGKVNERFKYKNEFYNRSQLLKKFDVEEFEDIDKSEYLTYYSLNLKQVIAKITR